MPKRLIRDEILDSTAVNSLSLRGEIFYRRLMSLVDDYGRTDARYEILRARLFALQFDSWSIEQVSKAVKECVNTAMGDGTPLLEHYTHNGKPYLQINNFGQRTRGESKFPAPADNDSRPATAPQLLTVKNTPPPQPAAVGGSPPQSAALVGEPPQPAAVVGSPPQSAALVGPTRARTRSEAEAETEAETKAYAKSDGARTRGPSGFDPSPGLRRFEAAAKEIAPHRWVMHPAESAWVDVVTSEATQAAVFAGLDRWRGCKDWTDDVFERWDRWLLERRFEQDPRGGTQQGSKAGVLSKLKERFA